MYTGEKKSRFMYLCSFKQTDYKTIRIFILFGHLIAVRGKREELSVVWTFNGVWWDIQRWCLVEYT